MLPCVVVLLMLLDVLLTPLHGDVHAPILAPEVALIPAPVLPLMAHGLATLELLALVLHKIVLDTVKHMPPCTPHAQQANIPTVPHCLTSLPHYTPTWQTFTGNIFFQIIKQPSKISCLPTGTVSPNNISSTFSILVNLFSTFLDFGFFFQ